MTQGPSKPPHKFVATRNPRTSQGKLNLAEIWQKVRVPLLVAVLLALGLTSLMLYTSERRTTRQAELTVSPEQAEALRLRSLQMEAAFEKIRQERFDLQEADIALLVEALRLQEEYITARQSIGTDNSRQESLRRRLHLLRGERLRQESDEAEAKALSLAKTDEEAALPWLRRALACELEIETKWEFSGLTDAGRRARLDTRLRRLESAPLWRQGRDREAEAEKLFTAGQFAAAAAQFQQAIESEIDFLARYRDVRNTEFGRSEKLAERRETALSGEAWRGVTAQRDHAEVRERAGDWPAATLAWQGAVDSFAKVLLDYPRSSFADRTQEAAMATRLNFARFHDDIAALRGRREQLRTALRERRPDVSIRLAEETLGEARRLAEANTGVFLPNSPERQELEYLATNGAVLRGVLASIDANLKPIPTLAVRMYRTEITQGLFASVMGANPSSTRREANPVESVTYTEAEAFSTRLGWILAAKVRLPTIAEFTAAVGGPRLPATQPQAWSAENTDGQTVRPVGGLPANTAGFQDLIGNAEEWGLAEPNALRAPALGGSVAMPLGKDLSVRDVFKREKSRTLGFRIVIE